MKRRSRPSDVRAAAAAWIVVGCALLAGAVVLLASLLSWVVRWLK